MKECTKCGEHKELTEFYPHRGGTAPSYKDCGKADKAAHAKTPHGVCKEIRAYHVKASKKEGRPTIPYTTGQLLSWLQGKGFDDMHEVWVESGYDSKRKPSCGRLDSKEDFRLDNLAFTYVPTNDGDMKLCPHCVQVKPLHGFYKSKSKSKGVTSWCIPCEDDRAKNYKMTERGLITSMFTSQVKCSKHRGHVPQHIR